MDTDTLLNIGLVVLFVLIGGVFAGTEMAIVTLRDSQVRAIEASGDRGRKIGQLVRNPNTFLSAVQIGVTLAGFFSSAYGASTIAPDLVPGLTALGLTESVASTVALIGMTLVVAYLSLVFGELVPKRLAMQKSVAFTKALAPPLNALARLMRPVIWLLSVSTNAVGRLLGLDPDQKEDEVSADEVRDIISNTSEIDRDSRSILADVLDADDRRVAEVMRPRPDVSFLGGDSSVSDGYRAVLALPHSRYPVVGVSRDDVLGFVHVRDLMASVPAAGGDQATTVADITRPILALPGTTKVLAALSTMRDDGHQIAVVIDEYGGTDGIVTLEDLLEELVGEIYDEYDTGDRGEGTLEAGESREVEGGLIVEELEEQTGVSLPDGPYETVGGWVFDALGRLAVVGDTLAVDGATLEVVRMEGYRIATVRVTPLEHHAEPPAEPATTAGPAAPTGP
ncbi:HlyC/CorC family transporter [Frigoribacterium sp. CFBP 13729]|jgi:putative hemolysin|uniref:hemolysin family protein n=1 Tax=Frigoribacterium sp. CFBP 13729 TaxID=2775293 RepID=UPI0017801FEE|nr:hemolysin family protein [Frigoribacterium sp. CFBP 13729]MBD8611920.1 HlyC/CorC family transporter [Frigoribacterium sp. CFBP 13729]